MPASPLTSLFAKSPITPIQEHMTAVQGTTLLLTPFLKAAMAGDWAKAKELQKQISASEKEADVLKKKIRINLPKNLFLPVPRSDLLELITKQDMIANTAQDIAGLMLGRKMEIPEKIAERTTEFLANSLDTVAQAARAISELDELLETGFRGREVTLVESLIKELDTLEGKNDKIEIKLRAALFKLEKDLPPVDTIFLYKVISLIGELANVSQGVGSRLQILLAR